MKRPVAWWFLLYAGLFAMFPLAARAGFGVSPAVLEVRNLRPQMEVRKEFFFSRGNPANTDRVEVHVEGPARWFVTGATTVELPSGQALTPYHITIRPRGSPPGTYEATVTVKLLPASEQGENQLTNLPAIQAKVRYTVTQEIVRAWRLREFTLENGREGQPLRGRYLLDNEGNVDARPTNILFSVADEAGRDVQSITLPEQEFPLVPPFSSAQALFSFGETVAPGNYRVTAVVSDGDRPVFTKERMFVQILPAGVSEQAGDSTESFQPTAPRRVPQWVRVSGGSVLVALVVLGIFWVLRSV